MPIYTTDFPGFGTLEIDSGDRDLSDDELNTIAKQQLQQRIAAQPPSEAQAKDFLSATSERVMEAGRAAKEIPESALDLITGGGTTGRLGAGLRLIQGVASPLSILTAPLEGATEAAAGTMIPPAYARLAGDVSGAAGTLGLGLLAKAGRLGPYALRLAEVLGAGRAGESLDQAMKRDPQLAYAAGKSSASALPSAPEIAPGFVRYYRSDVSDAKVPGGTNWGLDRNYIEQKYGGANSKTFYIDLPRSEFDELPPDILHLKPGTAPHAKVIGETPLTLEAAARGETSIEDLALQAKSPGLAQIALNQKQQASDDYLRAAKEGGFIADPPPEPRFSPSANIEFQAPGNDLGILGTLGTPVTRAAAIHPLGANAAMEMQEAELGIRTAIQNRAARIRQSLLGVGDDDLRAAITTRESGRSFDDAMKLPETALSSIGKRVLRFLQDKFDIDKNIIIPRLRSAAESRIEKQVVNEFRKRAKDWDEPVDMSAVRVEVAKRVEKAIPNDWGLSDYLPHIFPGFYKITDAKGNIIGTANTKLEAKYLLNDLAAAGQEMKGVKVESKSFFDSDLLHLFKGRVQRTYDSIAKGSAFDEDEIAAAIRGEYGFSKKFKFFGQLIERQGKSTGYTKDLFTILDTYDRGIERWMQLSDVAQKVTPTLRELSGKGYPNLSRMLESTLQQLWGYRAPISTLFDSTIAGIPVLRDIIAPYALDRMVRGTQSLVVNAFLTLNPRFHAVNATQLATTLWPVADGGDIARAIRLRTLPEGQALLQAHGISAGSKVAEFGKTLGPTERINQETAFLTMYNRARGYGLSDEAAASYGKLRGNVYSQFLGLVTDQPYAFQKAKFLTPLDLSTMFLRFPVKQYEMLMDLVKDRNFPGAAKWMASNLLLGGFKAATMGQAGWLTYRLYKDIEREYGKGVADVFHVGLPALAGVDVSSSVMLFNPPMGDNFAEKVGNMLGGPVGSVLSSVVGAALNSAAPEPNAAKRAFNALVQRVPLGRELDALRRLFEGDYELKDPVGRLRYKADTKDIVKRLLGARTLTDTDLDTFAAALLEVRGKRDDVLNYVASRHGQAAISGVDLGESMKAAVAKEVDSWNSLWPEFPITGEDVLVRAASRQQSAILSLRERLLKQAPAALRKSETFGLSEGGG